MTCLSATCEPRNISLSITGKRAHHVYYVYSKPRTNVKFLEVPWSPIKRQPRTNDRLISHWRALCLLAYDNWRCSIEPQIFTLPEPGFELRSTAGESSVLNARLQHVCCCFVQFIVHHLLM